MAPLPDPLTKARLCGDRVIKHVCDSYDYDHQGRSIQKCGLGPAFEVEVDIMSAETTGENGGLVAI